MIYSETNPLPNLENVHEFQITYRLSNEFRQEVTNRTKAKILNIMETRVRESMLIVIECIPEELELITDLAFMTWIKNPQFQTYYQNTPAFRKIAEEYLLGIMCDKCKSSTNSCGQCCLLCDNPCNHQQVCQFPPDQQPLSTRY